MAVLWCEQTWHIQVSISIQFSGSLEGSAVLFSTTHLSFSLQRRQANNTFLSGTVSLAAAAKHAVAGMCAGLCPSLWPGHHRARPPHPSLDVTATARLPKQGWVAGQWPRSSSRYQADRCSWAAEMCSDWPRCLLSQVCEFWFSAFGEFAYLAS